MTLLKGLWQLMEDKFMKKSQPQRVIHITSVFVAKDVLNCSTEAFAPWFISTLLVDFFINCKKVFLHLYETESMLVLASLALKINLHLNGICVKEGLSIWSWSIFDCKQGIIQTSLQLLFVDKLYLQTI